MCNEKKKKKNLFDWFGDLGANAITGEKSDTNQVGVWSRNGGREIPVEIEKFRKIMIREDFAGTSAFEESSEDQRSHLRLFSVAL